MPQLSAATGLLLGTNARGLPVARGSCFAFRAPGWFLTAAHCVQHDSAEALSIAPYTEGWLETGLGVKQVVRHPTADLALLHAPFTYELFQPFRDVDARLEPGSDVAAFGFPEYSLADGVAPIPRLFRGYAQRLFEHRDGANHKYVGIELSFGAPGGMSGGPVASSKDSDDVSGVIVSNLGADATMHAMTGLDEEGHPVMREVHSVIHYGIAVDLRFVREWLDAVVPKPGAG